MTDISIGRGRSSSRRCLITMRLVSGLSGIGEWRRSCSSFGMIGIESMVGNRAQSMEFWLMRLDPILGLVSMHLRDAFADRSQFTRYVSGMVNAGANAEL